MDESSSQSPSWFDRVRRYILSHITSKPHLFFVGGCLICAMSVYFIFFTAPDNFPKNTIVSVEQGESLQDITIGLKNRGVIRSPLVFRTVVILLGGEKRIIAGDYLLDTKENVITFAYRLVYGYFHIEQFKATIPEGWTVSQIGEYLGKHLTGFDTQTFISLAKNKEGYLFPDTYYILPKATPQDVVDRMTSNFSKKITAVQNIQTSGHSLSDVVIMASILEDEARTTESRQIISGILWKRLAIGMPLQVDSGFLYINGKSTSELTLADLKIDSPYNTYKYKGLPPGPIGNPGIDSLFAAANPVSSDYLYYLSDKEGNIYYAKTFEEHKKNKEKYLNK